MSISNPVLSAEGVTFRSLSVYVCRAPIENPVITAFGRMDNRPALFVHLTDEEGNGGWGEVWCNFPDCGAEHRARLLTTIFAPLIIGKSFSSPKAMFDALTEMTRVLALQSGEQGPIAQSISGLDIAFWDLIARRANQPLSAMLADDSALSLPNAVPAYASGINSKDVDWMIEQANGKGFNHFKVKVGRSEKQDIEAIDNALGQLRDDQKLMVDANQGWDENSVMAILPLLNQRPLHWIEEPIAVNAPKALWRRIRQLSHNALAGGENMIGEEQFREAATTGALQVIQPDICKWGGLTYCLAVARHVRQEGLMYCPHFLGGGIGLMASAHLLAAVGGEGMLEVDVNTNPLRDDILTSKPVVENGTMVLPSASGLGIEPDLDKCAPFIVFHDRCNASQ
ncbi:mandelate racemase/muconate lactonizing enzyme family protein [Grimontia marina]|uniref:Chloromuconate cycloisomerase n=1 Tax=Grimontia marina TaxID=646534 RepID=A0A128F908_9GAMM|nr:mandelate racemase/muconate lactonizing enzyme family protein [Grimontia marina]CZF82990.1 Chloromuconate cycloisomerase [Grimontia marina]